MAKQIYVINAGKLIDGKTEKVFHNYSVLVEGSTIREVGPTDQITGKIVKPTLKQITVTQHKRFKPISQSRKQFWKEISKSVKEI